MQQHTGFGCWAKFPLYLFADSSECNLIDYDILEVLSEYHNKAHDKHIELHLKGIEKVNIIAEH